MRPRRVPAVYSPFQTGAFLSLLLLSALLSALNLQCVMKLPLNTDPRFNAIPHDFTPMDSISQNSFKNVEFLDSYCFFFVLFFLIRRIVIEGNNSTAFLLLFFWCSVFVQFTLPDVVGHVTWFLSKCLIFQQSCHESEQSSPRQSIISLHTKVLKWPLRSK